MPTTARTARRSHRALSQRRAEGAALVEGLIVIPCLLIAFAGVSYVRDLHLAASGLRAHARRCAMQHALRGCSHMPANCADSLPTAGLPRLANAPDVAGGALARAGTLDLDPFDDIPVIGAAVAALFGSTTGARFVARAPHPFGLAGAHQLEGSFVVLCNERNASLGSVARDLACEHLPCW